VSTKKQEDEDVKNKVVRVGRLSRKNHADFLIVEKKKWKDRPPRGGDETFSLSKGESKRGGYGPAFFGTW